jgi:hypothetical protein
MANALKVHGKIEIAEDFDAPLPDDIQAGFDGDSER